MTRVHKPASVEKYSDSMSNIGNNTHKSVEQGTKIHCDPGQGNSGNSPSERAGKRVFAEGGNGKIRVSNDADTAVADGFRRVSFDLPEALANRLEALGGVDWVAAILLAQKEKNSRNALPAKEPARIGRRRGALQDRQR
jgi:hypothetical protein